MSKNGNTFAGSIHQIWRELVVLKEVCLFVFGLVQHYDIAAAKFLKWCRKVKTNASGSDKNEIQKLSQSVIKEATENVLSEQRW